MEKWKIAAFVALLLGFVGFGIYQQRIDEIKAKGPQVSLISERQPSVYDGKTLPPWNLKTWNSAPVSTQSLEGKPAFVEIFRTGCSHCEEAAPLMAAFHARYEPRGLKMVGIQSPGNITSPANPENKWPDVQAWLKQKGIKYPVAFDQGSKYFQGTVKDKVLQGDASKLLYPTMIMTDASGKVDFAQTGHDMSKALLLAVELERRFPTSDSPEKNADDLLAWLKKNVPGLEIQIQGPMEKELRDQLVERLKS